MVKLRKQIERQLLDYGFVDPEEAVNELMKLFEVEAKDINVQNVNNVYDIHYKDYIVRLRIERYQFVLVDVYPYDLSF